MIQRERSILRHASIQSSVFVCEISPEGLIPKTLSRLCDLLPRRSDASKIVRRELAKFIPKAETPCGNNRTLAGRAKYWLDVAQTFLEFAIGVNDVHAANSSPGDVTKLSRMQRKPTKGKKRMIEAKQGQSAHIYLFRDARADHAPPRPGQMNAKSRNGTETRYGLRVRKNRNTRG